MKGNLVNPFKNKYPQYLSFSMTVLLLALTFFLSMMVTLQGKNIRNISERFKPRITEKQDLQESENMNDWKTYRNERYGFESKYHPNSPPTETEGGSEVGQFTYLQLVEFGTVPLKSMFGYTLEINQNKSYKDYKLELVGHITDAINSEEKVTINNNSWTKFNYKIFLTTDYIPVTLVFTSNNNYGYAIAAPTSYIDQILSTFEFIDPSNEAEQTLITFFNFLHERQYSQAAEIYGGGYEVLQDWNPPEVINPENHPALLKNACEINGLQCLQVKNIIRRLQKNPDEFLFTVQFTRDDGSLFERGPCCGATEEQMPTETDFDYPVKKSDGIFKVMGLPVYVP